MVVFLIMLGERLHCFDQAKQLHCKLAITVNRTSSGILTLFNYSIFLVPGQFEITTAHFRLYILPFTLLLLLRAEAGNL